MLSPEFDPEGYPTEATLKAIRKWNWEDTEGLITFIQKAWRYPDYIRLKRDVVRGGILKQRVDVMEISTGGWSGNEEIITALMETTFWHFYWQSSERGGHYKFHIKKATPASAKIPKSKP